MLESLKYANCVVATIIENFYPCQSRLRKILFWSRRGSSAWRIQPLATQFNSKLLCSFLLITKKLRQEQKCIPLWLSSLFAKIGINMSSSSLLLLFNIFNFYYLHTLNKTNPCSRSHGRTSSPMYHLRRHFQASNCSQTTCQSCPFEDQGNLLIVRESIHGQKVTPQASTNSSSRSLVTTTWRCKCWCFRSL